MDIITNLGGNDNDNHKFCKDVGKDILKLAVKYTLKPPPPERPRKKSRRGRSITQESINQRRW